MPAQDAGAEKDRQTLASIRDEQTAKELHDAIRRWREAGKPHKR